MKGRRRTIKAYLYDVFCSDEAGGNPCAVIVLDKWLPQEALHRTAIRAAQPVTAFVVANGENHQIRWFSVSGEINLCGHGSLGAAAALMNESSADSVSLTSDYGNISILKQDDWYRIELPAWKGTPAPADVCPVDLPSLTDRFATRDLILVLDSEQAVLDFQPDMNQIRQMPNHHALIVTAQSGDDEYVLRYFVPKIGIPEDSATGSAQCSLAPYWLEKLKRNVLNVRQISDKGGYFRVEKSAHESVLVFARAQERAIIDVD